MQNRKQKGRGGKRKGAGRKPKYSEPTTTIAFRVPESKVKSVTDAVKGVVNNVQADLRSIFNE